MKSILVTGAAQGIGYAIAQRFACAGWRVGLFDLNVERCEQHARSPEFPNAVAGFCDVTSRDSVEQALQQFLEATEGRLDVLVNNAGVLSAGAFADMSPAQINAMISVNIQGLTNVAHVAFPALRDTPGAVMVNLCSSSSIHGIQWLAVYSASKFYVNGLTQALNIEWEPFDIHVVSIKPPAINTSMGHALDERHLAKMKIANEPDDVADAVWSAVHRRPQHVLIGGATKVWYWLTKLLPAPAAKRLMKLLVD